MTRIARVRSGASAAAIPAVVGTLILLGAARAERPNGRDLPPPQQCFEDIHGEIHRPFEDPEVRAVVLVFVVIDCPIANSYAPELNRLHADYQDRGVRLFVMQVDPELSAEDARKHAGEYELRPPIVLDNRHVWVQKVGATITPEAAVLSPRGKLLYVGRIDDRYADLGKRREQATSHDLRQSIDAVLAGRPVGRLRIKAVGCDIPELKKGP